MSREEIKVAINQILDDTPDEALNGVLEYLKSLMDKSVQTVSLAQNLRTILSEDKELLERLAK